MSSSDSAKRSYSDRDEDKRGTTKNLKTKDQSKGNDEIQCYKRDTIIHFKKNGDYIISYSKRYK